MAKEWAIASEYEGKIRFAGTFEQHMLIAHYMDAAEIFVPRYHTIRVTSANDGQHMLGSRHYENKALDFRVWNWTDKEKWAVVQYLNYKHPDEDWVNEGDHIHGEYDPK